MTRRNRPFGIIQKPFLIPNGRVWQSRATRRPGQRAPAGTALTEAMDSMDDDAVAAVSARVARIRAGASPAEALSPGAVRDIRRLRATPGWEHDLHARLDLGWLHWYRYEELPAGQDDPEADAAVEALVPCFVAGLEPLPEQLLPELAGGAFPLAAAMLQRAMSSPGPEPVAAAAALYRRIVAAVPGDYAANRGQALSMLGFSLQLLFERTGDPADLDAAVTAGRQGADAVPSGHPGVLAVLVNLAVGLRMRYDRTGATAGRGDIDEAITLLRRASALAAGGADTAVLVNLCASLRARYDRYGDAADLQAAIDAGRRGIAAAPAGHPERLMLFVNLGVALASRFRLASDPADLTEAVGLLAAAYDQMPVPAPDRHRAAASLAAVLSLRFDVTGAEADLDRAIDTLRGALAGPVADPRERARLAGNLSVGLWTRFRQAGGAADLDAAIDAGGQAVAGLPAGDVELPLFQSNLGIALRERYERNRDPRDVHAAVAAARAAVTGTEPGHLDAARRLVNLGNALREKSDDTGLAGDIAEAVEALSKGAGMFPVAHPDRARALSGLGNALRTLSSQSGAPGHLDYAIKVLREAAGAVPPDRPERAMPLFNLGKALQSRHQMTTAADDRDEAITVLSEVAATRTAAPYLRAQAARSAAALAAGSRPLEAAAHAETAVHLLPAVAPRRIGRGDQERYLGDFFGLASDAAALALLAAAGGAAGAANGSTGASRALGLLEAGRGVLLSQALETRDDLTDLAASHPEVAARYVRLRELISLGTEDDEPSAPADDGKQAALRLERRAGDRHRLAADFEATAHQIRALPGFARFMLPPRLPDLLRQAGPSTVVAVNVSPYRSDAIILSGGTVTCLPLPGLAADTVDTQTALLARLTDPRKRDYGTAANNALSELLEWLWDAATGPVLDHLGCTGVPAPEADPPRIWWMPGGLPAVLPLHAAGHHRERGGRTVLDRVVSSYTPTVRALGWARGRAGSAPPERSLVVAMPTTPGGVPPLRYAAREASELATILPDPVVLIEGSDPASGPVPTRDAVLAAMADAGIAHFACHASGDPADPSNGRLILHDHETRPLTIGRLAAGQLDRAQLAYLSACETSHGASARLTDESVHLASAFQLAGYPQVIGTLWPVYDRFAAEVARGFYGRLREARRPFATDAAASALRGVIRGKRDDHADIPLFWAAYLHAGA
jgi:CHAT domain